MKIEPNRQTYRVWRKAMTLEGNGFHTCFSIQPSLGFGDKLAFALQHRYADLLLACMQRSPYVLLLHHRDSSCSKVLQIAVEAVVALIADDGVVRVTASLSRAQEAALKDLAAKHKVSIAWLVRYAVDQLVEQGREAQLPLDFGRRG